MRLLEKMRCFKGTRVGEFCALLLILIIFYLLDCLASTEDSKPWIERGVQSRGFGWTVLAAFGGFVFLVVGKKEK